MARISGKIKLSDILKKQEVEETPTSFNVSEPQGDFLQNFKGFDTTDVKLQEKVSQPEIQTTWIGATQTMSPIVQQEQQQKIQQYTGDLELFKQKKEIGEIPQNQYFNEPGLNRLTQEKIPELFKSTLNTLSEKYKNGGGTFQGFLKSTDEIQKQSIKDGTDALYGRGKYEGANGTQKTLGFLASFAGSFLAPIGGLIEEGPGGIDVALAGLGLTWGSAEKTISETLQTSGLIDNQQTADDVSFLSTLAIGSIAGKLKNRQIKSQEISQAFIDEATKIEQQMRGGGESPIVKKMWQQYSMKTHPDKVPPKFYDQATILQAELNGAYKDPNFSFSKMQEVAGKIDKMVNDIKYQASKNTEGKIDFGAIFNKEELSVLDKLKQDIKTKREAEGIKQIDIRDSIIKSGIGLGSVARQELAIDYVNGDISIDQAKDIQDIGEVVDAEALSKQPNIEVLKQGIDEIKKYPETESTTKAISEIERMISEIGKYEESQMTPAKSTMLNEQYGPELVQAVSNAKMNMDTAKKGATGDQYTKIEESMGTKKNLKKVYDLSQEYISRRGLDMTTQEVFEEIVDKLNIPAKKRITKLELKESLEKPITENIVNKPKELNKTEQEIIKKYKIDQETLNQLYEENKIDCVGGMCGLNAVKNYIDDKGQGKIQEGMFLPASKGLETKEQALEYFKNNYERQKQNTGGRSPHFWYEKNGEILNDEEFNKGRQGFYITKENKVIEFKQPEIKEGEIEIQKIPTETGKEVAEKKEKISIRKKLEETRKKAKEENIQKTAEEIIKLSSKVKTTDVADLFKRKGGEVVAKALDFAEKKGMITKEVADNFREGMKNTLKYESEAPKGTLNDTQILNLNDLLGWDKLLKGTDSFKIIIPQVKESLKNLQAKLHLVNPPEGQRVKLPFSLMGNKSATYKNVLLPVFKKAIEKGSEVYIEPFGGAGTTYYFAPEMFESGLKEININHFDNEKFAVISAIKEKRIDNIEKEISIAYDEIFKEIGEVLQDIPEVKEIMELYKLDIKGEEFKDTVEVFFYPEYAKQFFEENPDTKLAIKGELTENFKAWLGEKLKTEAKEKGIEMTPQEVLDAVEITLNDRAVFERKYPTISKRIEKVLDKFDVIDFDKKDYKTAIKTAMARHLRQRGDAGQKVISATNSFQNVLNVKKKMIDGLNVYKNTFDKYGDKINIYNMDGKEFVKEMGKYNNEKTISYFDPPYVRTTAVYVKNQPKEIQESLGEYADVEKLANIFKPLNKTIMSFTNDVDGKYFESIDKLTGGRLSKDIIAYKEGTTPTSLLLTNEIAVKPKDVGLQYYTILQDRFIKDIVKSLDEGLLPKIKTQLQKHIAKLSKHLNEQFQKKFGEMTKIQDQIFKGKEAFDNLQESLDGVTSLKEKQEIIREAKKWLKQNSVTGKEVSQMIDKINKLWIRRGSVIENIRDSLDSFRKSGVIDAEVKKEFFDNFNEKYTEKRLTGPLKEQADIIENINKGGDFTKEDFEIYDKWLTDSDYAKKIDEITGKQSLYDMELDELVNLQTEIGKYMLEGNDTFKYNKKLRDNYIQELTTQAEKNVKPLNKRVSITGKLRDKARLSEGGIGRVANDMFNEIEGNFKEKITAITPPVWVMDEDLNIYKTVYDIINEGLGNFRQEVEDVRIRMTNKEKELKISDKGYDRITLHGLAKRGDGKGIPKLIALLKKEPDPINGKIYNTAEEIKARIQEYKSDEFLSKEETQMYEFMKEEFRIMGEKVKDVRLKEENDIMTIIPDYFPIKIDFGKNVEKFGTSQDPQIDEKRVSMFKTIEANQGFTKETTNLELVPQLDALQNFYTHMEKTSYYVNMQPKLHILNEVVNNLGIKLGDLGKAYMKDYIDTLARQGIKETQVGGLGRFIAGAGRKFQQAVLGFSPTTIAIQTSALLQAKALGLEVKDINIGNVIKNWDLINQKSQLMKHRELRNIYGYEGAKWDKGLLEKWNRTGFIPLQLVDNTMAKFVWWNKYQESIQKGLSEKDAIYEADVLTQKALTNSHFEGKSQFILKNERGVGSLFTMFQTFVSYQFAILRYGGGKAIQQKYGKIMGYMYAFIIGGLLLALYEEFTRRNLQKALYGKEPVGGLTENAISNMLGYIPVLNTIYGAIKFGGFGSFKGYENSFNGIGKMIVAIMDDNKDITNTQIINTLTGIGQIFGIGGTTEASRWAKKIFKETKETNTTTSSGRTTRRVPTRTRTTRRVPTRRVPTRTRNNR